MAYWHYDRLSALDSVFLDIEEPNVHMHVAAVALFEAGPLLGEDGSLDIERIRGAVELGLRCSARFRQRLAQIPLFDHPVWVDDERFNVAYHLRHTSLPRPGGIRLLKRLAGRILSQKLDRGKPLWEMWVVEGVEDDRFALIVKAHHAMVDGISGMDLLAGMLRLDPDPSLDPEPRPWIPRPAPTRMRLLADEAVRRGTWPLAAAGMGRSALCSPQQLLGQLRESALGIGEIMKAGMRPTSPTPLNADVGPHRRFDWLRVDLGAAREVRTRLGGTLNDVVLATAAGAIGRFLRGRGLRIEDLLFRAQVPMSIRNPAERGEAGNRVVMLLAELPIAVRDPRERLARVIETTKELKRSRQRAGVELLEELGDRTLTSVFLFFARLATWQRSFNAVITNVPGPPAPVYLLGARMREIYPLVPLAHNQALGLALFSYDGGLHWGLNADWDAVPDLHDLVEDLVLEFEGLRKAAAEG
jgi:WS/DGAT/MGAT family acyltransferase